jgi:hypothetical protein
VLQFATLPPRRFPAPPTPHSLSCPRSPAPSLLKQVVLPRPQPRIPADRLEKHLEAGLREAGLL